LTAAKADIKAKEDLLAGEAKIREDNAYAKLKEERDKKYYDLESVKLDEEGQVQDLTDQYNEWIQMRNRAANNTDDAEFREYHSRALEVKKQLQAA